MKLEYELINVEDNSYHMKLEKLYEGFRNTVLNEYKRNIYRYLRGK